MAEQVVSEDLVMTFLTAEEKELSLTVHNPLDTLESDTVSGAMEEIVSKNVFQDKNGNLIVSSVGAKVRSVTDDVLF